MNILNQQLQDNLDLLAEGELPQEQRAELFARLDSTSDGWKQCALALLEQRALADSIGEIKVSNNDAEVTCPQHSLATQSGLSRVNWGQLLTLATLGILLVTSGWLLGLSSARMNQSTIVQIPPEESQIHLPQSTTIEPQLMRQVRTALGSTGIADIEILALVGIGDPDNQKIYPVIRSADLSRKMTALPKPKLPPAVAREMEQFGWELKTHQQFISIELPDGQTETVPVGMLNYRFVGRETF